MCSVTGQVRSAVTGFSTVGKASVMVGGVIQKRSVVARKEQRSSQMDVPPNKNKSKKFMKRLVMRRRELSRQHPVKIFAGAVLVDSIGKNYAAVFH